MAKTEDKLTFAKGIFLNEKNLCTGNRKQILRNYDKHVNFIIFSSLRILFAILKRISPNGTF